MIKNIIFDIGNVLVNFDWDGYMKKLFPGQDALNQELSLAVWGDRRWERLDAGEEPEKVFVDIIKADPVHEKELRKVLDSSTIGMTLSKRPETPGWLESLKLQGYKIYYLSNYSHYMMDANPEVLDFLPMMDGGIFSCDVKLLKPELAIYETLAKKYNLVPSECVFIDDIAANVEGAVLFGFKGIQYKTREQVLKDLNSLLQKGK